jgi:hypothetical protein
MPRVHTVGAMLSLILTGACQPDSDHVLFAVRAHAVHGSDWTPPVNLGAPINTMANEAGPTLSHDGLALYFASNRTGGAGGNDLWVARRACDNCPWQAPVNLGTAINTASVEAGPSLSGDGHLLFFTSDRPGGPGLNDIYVTRRADPTDDFGWGPPVPVGSAVNTATHDEQAAEYAGTAEIGRTNFYFTRVPAGGTADIHAAAVSRNGATVGGSTPVDGLNDPGANDQGATLRGDGREVVFFSTRSGGVGGNDLWGATRRSSHDGWSVPENLASLNSAAADQQPSLTSNGTILLFASNRGGGAGGQDIWMSTRVAP